MKIVGIYKKKLSSISVFLRQSFLLDLSSTYKMVDIMNIYKSLYISIVTVMKKPEMLKFVSDHLETKAKLKFTLSIEICS